MNKRTEKILSKFSENVDYLSLQYRSIKGTLDVSKYKNLKSLSCGMNPITNLILPDSLEELVCNFIRLKEIVLPPNLTYLDIRYTPFEKIHFNKYLKIIVVNSCNLNSIDFLAEYDSIQYIYADGNPIKSVKKTPKNLKLLDLSYTKISSLDFLPYSLETLYVRNCCDLESLYYLPDSLKCLCAEGCQKLHMDTEMYLPKNMTYYEMHEKRVSRNIKN